MIVLLCILLLPFVASMDENTISNVVDANAMNDDNAVNASAETNGTLSAVTNGTLEIESTNQIGRIEYCKMFQWAMKYALLHPFSYFVTVFIDTILIFSDQPALAAYATSQFGTNWLRFAYPNICCGCVRKLNEFAAYCGLPAPKYDANPSGRSSVITDDITPNQNSISQPLLTQNNQDEELPQNLDTVTTQVPQVAVNGTSSRNCCYSNCGIIFGNLFMHKYSMLFTVFLLWIYTYDDSIVLGIWMTIQILILLIRTKCPNLSCARKLNQWANDANVPDALITREKESNPITTLAPHDIRLSVNDILRFSQMANQFQGVNQQMVTTEQPTTEEPKQE